MTGSGCCCWRERSDDVPGGCWAHSFAAVALECNGRDLRPLTCGPLRTFHIVLGGVDVASFDLSYLE